MGSTMTTRPLLYLAGPYSADPVLCSRAAMVAGTAIYRHTHFVPVVPHLSILWDEITPMPYEDWLAIDFAVIARCHAITRLPGESPGADLELVHAEQVGVPLVPFNELGPMVTSAYWEILQTSLL